MKYLVPLARANEADCLRLVDAIKDAKLSTRQMGQLYQTYMTGNDKTRELVVTEPLLVLRVEQQAQTDLVEASGVEVFISDLHALGALARRAYAARRGLSALPPDRERAARAFRQAQADFIDLQNRWEKENARSRHEGRGPDAQGSRTGNPPDSPRASDLAGSRGRSSPWERPMCRTSRGPVGRSRTRKRSSSYSSSARATWCACTRSFGPGRFARTQRSPPFAAGTDRPRAAPAGRPLRLRARQEMQHDTSPHRAKIAGAEQRIETASLVLCYSRMLFFQCYPVFNRFHCKVFLTDALTYLQGAAAVCMIDNTHLVVASGTGREMVPAPEMAAFADRFGFVFRAHEKGDANRSARVERPFRFIEGNFLAGRSFTDFDDLNRQALDFCDKVNA